MSDIIVIKIGGIASQSLSADFVTQIKTWQTAGKQLVIVHGGGFAITERLEKEQIETIKVNGLRVTAKKHMPLITQVLLENVGAGITATLEDAGLTAHQLTETLKTTVQADFLNQKTYGYVGQATTIKTDTLEHILTKGHIPVLASLGYSVNNEWLNINADYLATAVAQALKAKKLILMTDVKGILEKGQVLSTLAISEVPAKIANGVITGGMIPKIESAVKTVQSGVKQVSIGDNLLTGTIITGG